MRSTRLFSAIIVTLMIGPLLIGDPSIGQELDSSSKPLKLSIHYLDGLTSRSDSNPEIRFLGFGCPLSLLLTNDSDAPVVLWKPYCPPGDAAISLEFKLDKDSQEIGEARTSHGYTGGMGIPKTMTIAAGDSLVYQIDFSSYWSLPFVLESGQQRTVFVRAVYESKRIDPASSIPLPDDASAVWEGGVETDWQRVTITNVTNETVPKFHRGMNILK